MSLIVAYPMVLLPWRMDVSKLLATWRSREFWLQRYFWLHWVSLLACTVFWVSSITQVLRGGDPPLLGWMLSAYHAGILTTRVNLRVFAQTRSVATAMLLLQMAMIIVFNGVMVIAMAYKGVGFVMADLPIALAAVVGSIVTKMIAWRMKDRLDEAWRLSGYAMAQKSAPQVVQAGVIFFSPATLGVLAILSLLVQGLSRLVLSVLARKNNPTKKGPRAQFWNASTDFSTVFLITAAVIRDVAR